MENGNIEDYQITSPSSSPGLEAKEGRLNGDTWSAAVNDSNQWIQVDL